MGTPRGGSGRSLRTNFPFIYRLRRQGKLSLIKLSDLFKVVQHSKGKSRWNPHVGSFKWVWRREQVLLTGVVRKSSSGQRDGVFSLCWETGGPERSCGVSALWAHCFWACRKHCCTWVCVCPAWAPRTVAVGRREGREVAVSLVFATESPLPASSEKEPITIPHRRGLETLGPGTCCLRGS